MVRRHPRRQPLGEPPQCLFFDRGQEALLTSGCCFECQCSGAHRRVSLLMSVDSVTPFLIVLRVSSSDSRGTESRYLPISHSRPNGIDRLRLIDSHSTKTPFSSSLNLQYEFIRQRKPLSFPGSPSSTIRVATLLLDA